MRHRGVCLIAIAVVLSATLALAAPLPDEIPFKLAQGFGIVVRGGVGSMNNLNFLVDTGAVPSVLSERVASRIGVSGVRGSYALLHKDIEAQYVTVDEVRVGWIRATDFPMVVVDLSRLERFLGRRIDAIIGLDILVRQNFSIDYHSGKIRRGISGLRHVVPAEIYTAAGAPYWVLPITLGGHLFRMLLDTGANDLALFAGHTPKPILALTRAAGIAANLTGKANLRALGPLRLVMGDMPLRNQVAFVLEQPLGALPEIDGVLGPAALRITRIELDWEHKCVRWDGSGG
jgi:hypothetical protein